MRRPPLGSLSGAAIALGALLVGCARTTLGDDTAPEASVDCTSEDPDLPTDLACTGIYADFASKTPATNVEPFTPAVPLWSDGSGKVRYAFIPDGATIDRTDPDEWVYPNGTKLWKEFSRDGKRIETRFFHKLDDGTWAHTTYVWSADESSATRVDGGASIALADGGTYTVPTADQCTYCHGGRPEPVMGFEEVSLGTAGATGLTLAQLATLGRLSPAPTTTTLSIGDDGTGKAAPALAWMHINCGVSCHNRNATSWANAMGMYLKLDVATLDGRLSSTFDSIVTTAGVEVAAVEYKPQLRIEPGAPDSSVLMHLISTRALYDQMPPLATDVVDTEHAAQVHDWIAAMPPLAGAGATNPGSEADAGGD